MKEIFINNSLKLIKDYYPEYDETKLNEIKYGLLTVYLTISKLIFISLCSIVLGIFKEFIIFTIIYIFIRMPSFGIHATKSWICNVSSLITFIAIPLLCKYLIVPINIIIIIGIIFIILIYKNSPADTANRPIINSKRRRFYKLISTFISIVMVILAIIINNSFISNAFIFALLFQNIMISPFTYKVFKLPYDNYKKYIN